jgi:opacity protein-like surface antigen
MRKLLLAAAAAMTLIAAAPAANATVIPITFAFAGDGSGTADFGDKGILTSTFSDTFTFTLPTGFASGSVTTVLAGASTDVSFTSVTLNGTPFGVTASGAVDTRSLVGLPVTSGPQTLLVSGTVNPLNPGGPFNGGFGGSLSFVPGGVPEPASWALMMLGFGGLGGVLRTRRRASRLTLA